MRGGGGHLEVASRAPHGTRVRVALPARAPAPQRDPVPSGGRQVLVVDPEVVSRQVLHTTPEDDDDGHRVVVVPRPGGARDRVQPSVS